MIIRDETLNEEITRRTKELHNAADKAEDRALTEVRRALESNAIRLNPGDSHAL